MNAQTNVLVAKINIVNSNLVYTWSVGDTSTKQFNISLGLFLNNVSIPNLTVPANVSISCQTSASNIFFTGISFSNSIVLVSNTDQVIVSVTNNKM